MTSVVTCLHLAVLIDLERNVCPQGDRLLILQRQVAELELNQKRMDKKNSRLESQKDKLKKDRSVLKDTLKQVSTVVHPLISITSTLTLGF